MSFVKIAANSRIGETFLKKNNEKINHKCITEAHQFISALHSQFWLGAVIASASNFQKNGQRSIKIRG